jgi:hypothetical protein
MSYIGKTPDSLVTGQNTSEDIFTATSNQTAFTLTADVVIETDIIVSINGVVQSGTAYGMSGTGNRTLTFTTGLTVGDKVRVLHIGFKPTTTVFADNSVITQKLAANAVTVAKIADDAVTAAKIHGDVVLGGPSLGTNSVIRTNANTISENITFLTNTNGSSVGTITIASGSTVTITSGALWKIL